MGHNSTTLLVAGQQYVFVPHRWLMKWRSFVAGDSDPPDDSILAIAQRDHVHGTSSPSQNGRHSPPDHPFFLPPPYVLEFLGGKAEERAVIPKYGFPGKVGKKGALNENASLAALTLGSARIFLVTLNLLPLGSSKLNETIFNTFRQVEGLPIQSLEVVHYEAVFGVASSTLSQDDSPAPATVKQKGLAHFYPDANWDQLPTVGFVFAIAALRIALQLDLFVTTWLLLLGRFLSRRMDL